MGWNFLRGDDKPGGGVFGFLRKNVVEPTVNPAFKFLNTAAAFPRVVTGNREGAKRILVPGGGLGHQGGVLGGEELSGEAVLLKPKNIKKVAGTGLSIGSNLVAPGVGGTSAKLGAKIAKGAATGAGISTLSSAGEQLSSSDTFNPRQLATDTLFGAVLGGGASPIGRGIKPVYAQQLNDGEQLRKLARATTPQEVRKNLKNKLPDDVIDRVAPAIAQTKDPNIIDNIIQRAYNPPAPAAATPPPSLIDATVPKSVAPTPSTTRPRGFLTSAQKAENISPEVKQGLSEIEPQTYAQKPNAKLVAKTKKIADKNPNEALQRVMEDVNTPARYDEDVALGGHLIQKAQKEGRIEEAVRIAERLDVKGRELGRGVQAFSVIARLNPEGVLLYAQRQVRKAREVSGRIEGEAPTAKTIKTEIEGFSQADSARVQGAVRNTVKQIADEQLPLNLDGVTTRTGAVENTGTQLAKKVEKAAAPQVKKKANVLANELAKRVKEEYLAPTTANKKSPMALLREVFGRNKEAQEAYPYAQEILRERYRNVPTMLKVLDKFFGSRLGNIPAASSTINSAIREQLLKNEVRVSQAIFESWAKQKQTVEDVTNALIKEGFDKNSAGILGKEVTKRLNQQFNEVKIRTLERLSKDAPKRAQQTYIDKINKLSNVGALDNEDYLQLARAKLKLPDLPTDVAKDISKLAQEMQGLPDGYEKFKLMEQVQEKIQAIVPMTGREKMAQTLGAAKSSLASFDISGAGRQGAVLGSRFLKTFGKAEKNSLSYFKSKESFDRAMADHATSKNADIYDDWGIDWAKPGAQFKEEAYRSSLPEKVPGFGRGVAASNRAFSGVLSDMRLGAADNIIKHFDDIGVDVRQWPDSWKKSMGRFINTASGRGQGKEGGVFEKWVPFLNDTLFSPRLWKSRLDMLNPKYYYDLKGPARAYALQSAGSFAGIASTVLGLAVLAGAEVETDARSSDFLKIKVGDTRYDILGGFQQNIVFAWRELSGEKKSSQSGQVTSLIDGGFGLADRASILGDLIENKSNPLFGFLKKQITGKDQAGNELTPKGRVGELVGAVTPLSLQDTYSQVRAYGPAGLPRSIPSYVGAGSQTYGVRDINISDRQKATLRVLEQQGASKEKIDATKLFYQTLKTTPKRDKASEKINEALAAGDTQGAIQIAKEYNEKYADSFKKWAEQYGDYINDEDLVKEYNAGKIKMTGSAIKRRLNEIRENPLYQVKE